MLYYVVCSKSLRIGHLIADVVCGAYSDYFDS